MSVYFPDSVAKLHTYLAEIAGPYIMAGGTDLLVRLRASGITPENIVCLEKVENFKKITCEDSNIRIGSAVTITDLCRNEIITEKLPLLAESGTSFASPPVRNMATVGGNICTASPAGDTLPALYALGASVELVSAEKVRTVTIEDFINGPGKNVLNPAEVLTAVIVPIPEGFTLHHFEKVGQRNALAISVVSMAAMLAVNNGFVTQARFAWGCVGPTIVRSSEIDTALVGSRLTLSALREVAEIARKEFSPISDIRASADYRCRVAGNLLLRLAAL